MHLQHLIAIAGISGLASGAVVPSGLETRSDDPGFVYEQAYRIRIAKNAEFPDFTDRDYDRILPGLPDSDSQLSTWWFGYQSAGTRFTNIAVAQLWPSAVYYEQVYHSEFSSTVSHTKIFQPLHGNLECPEEATDNSRLIMNENHSGKPTRTTKSSSACPSRRRA